MYLYKFDNEKITLNKYTTLAEGNYLIEARSFGAQMTDVSYGRYPDGGSKWSVMPLPGCIK